MALIDNMRNIDPSKIDPSWLSQPAAVPVDAAPDVSVPVTNAHAAPVTSVPLPETPAPAPSTGDLVKDMARQQMQHNAAVDDAQMAPARARFHAAMQVQPSPPVAYKPHAAATQTQPASQPSLMDHVKAYGGGGGASSRFDPYKNRTAALDQIESDNSRMLQRQLLLGDQRRGLADERIDEGDRFGKEMAAVNARGQQDTNDAASAYKQAATDLAGDKIDAEHWWASRSTGQKLAAGIGAIFGGMLQGYRGLPNNPALDQMNRLIDRDIQAQKDNHETKRQGVEAKRSMYAMAVDHWQNERAATNDLHATYLDKLVAEGDKIAASEKDEEARSHWFETRDKLIQQRAEYKDAALIEARRAAAAGAMTPERYAKLMREASEIDKTRAETAHTNAETANLARTGPKLTDEQKSQREVDANLKSIDAAKKNVDQLTSGTSMGNFAAEHLPRWMPGVEDAMTAVNDRNAYNNRVKAAIAAGYKLSTDANEPKNLALIEEYAAPYEVKPGDSPELARQKMGNLEKFIVESGAAKGTVDRRPSLQQQFQQLGAPPPTFRGVGQ